MRRTEFIIAAVLTALFGVQAVSPRCASLRRDEVGRPSAVQQNGRAAPHNVRLGILWLRLALEDDGADGDAGAADREIASPSADGDDFVIIQRKHAVLRSKLPIDPRSDASPPDRHAREQEHPLLSLRIISAHIAPKTIEGFHFLASGLSPPSCSA